MDNTSPLGTLLAMTIDQLTPRNSYASSDASTYDELTSLTSENSIPMEAYDYSRYNSNSVLNLYRSLMNVSDVYVYMYLCAIIGKCIVAVVFMLNSNTKTEAPLVAWLITLISVDFFGVCYRLICKLCIKDPDAKLSVLLMASS